MTIKELVGDGGCYEALGEALLTLRGRDLVEYMAKQVVSFTEREPGSGTKTQMYKAVEWEAVAILVGCSSHGPEATVRCAMLTGFMVGLQMGAKRQAESVDVA